MSRNLLLLILAFFSLTVHGQVATIVPTVPTSPQAESFKLHGEYAVNMFSGTPDISIPLYEINHYGYKLPLSLKYVARPLKPGYNYDVLGLGWGLSISSCVSRAIEYVPDEWRNFKLEDPGVPCNLAVPQSTCLNDYNFAHDKFNVVLPNGSSFDFIIENQNEQLVYKISDARKVKISFDLSNSVIHSFTIIDESGVKYTFSGADYPRSGGYFPHSGTYVSWSLSRIDLPYTAEPILFSYGVTLEPFATTCGEAVLNVADYRKSVVTSTKQYFHEYTVNRGTEYLPSAHSMKLLTMVSFGYNGQSQIRLLYKNGGALANTRYVDKIQVWDGAAQKKEVAIHTTTSEGQSPCFTFQLAMLDSVVFKANGLSESTDKYSFSYHSRGIFSGIDHWGNLNSIGVDLPNFNVYIGWDINATGNSGVLTSVNKEPNDPSPFFKAKVSIPAYSASDCKSASAPAAHGVLNRITFPTGGYTDFVFENHTFLTSMDGNGNMEYTPEDRLTKDASSYRIKSMTSYSSDGIMAGKKNYRYGQCYGDIYGSSHPERFKHVGYGMAVVDPNIETYLSYAQVLTGYSTMNMVLGKDVNGGFQTMQNIFYNGSMPWEWGWAFTLSASNFRRALGGRPHVVYPEVTVYDGEIDEVNNVFPLGKTVYKYDLRGETNMPVVDAFFEPLKKYGNTLSYEPKGYFYNRLAEKTEYKFDAGIQDFRKIRRESNEWWHSSINYLDYQYGFDFLPEGLKLQTSLPFNGFHASGQYFYFKECYIGGILPLTKAITVYAENGDSIKVSESYAYNDRSQLASKTTVNSRGESIINQFKYPDLLYASVFPMMSEMVAKNIISPVIETAVSKYPSNEKLSGKKVEYNTFGSSQMIMPAKVYDLVPGSANPDFTLEGEVVSYSSNGNPLETISKDNVTSSYIWGYDDRYMIAQATNANSADIAYSSFEESSKGNWNYSGTIITPASGVFVPTGKKYYDLTTSTAISKVVGAGKTYVVSYWRNVTGNAPFAISGASGNAVKGRSLNGWSYFEHIVTTSGTTLTVSGTGAIDELRLYPEGARVASFTHDPLIGVTSQTDAAGAVTYYEYDLSGRLSIVRDLNMNILKRICYNYAGQPEPCKVYYNTAKSQMFTRNNCSAGYEGGSYTYTVPANTYVGSSPEEADQLALNDIAQNGQNAANEYASCTAFYLSPDVSDYYYNENCPAGTAQPLYINMPVGSYKSYISEYDAYMHARAQAQNWANSAGGCNTVSTFPFNVSNATSQGKTIILTNTSNSNSHYFYSNANTSSLTAIGQIPSGTYNVQIINDGYYNSFYYGIAGYYGYANQSITIYNVSLDQYNSNMYIY